MLIKEWGWDTGMVSSFYGHCKLFFHSTAYVYFDSAFICSFFWREICVQLDFDFEQCQIPVIWMNQMQLGTLKPGKKSLKREIKGRSQLFRGISYLHTSIDLVMLCDCVVWVRIKGDRRRNVSHCVRRGQAGVTNLIGSGPRCHYFVSSRINILDESRCFRADTIFRAVLDHTMIFSGYSLNKNKVFLAGVVLLVCWEQKGMASQCCWL